MTVHKFTKKLRLTEPVNKAPDFVLDFQNEPMLKDQLTLRNEYHGIEWNNRCCGSHLGF